MIMGKVSPAIFRGQSIATEHADDGRTTTCLGAKVEQFVLGNRLGQKPKDGKLGKIWDILVPNSIVFTRKKRFHLFWLVLF